MTTYVTNLAPPPVVSAFIDPKSGKLTTEGLRFLQQLWERTGGSSGDSIYDALDLSQASSASEGQLFAIRSELQQEAQGILLSFIEQVQEQTIAFPTEDMTAGLLQQTLDTAAVQSVFGRTGSIVATEGDYVLDMLGDVTLTTPASAEVLQFNGSAWVNAPISSISSADFIQFNTAYVGADAVGKLMWNDTDGTLEFGLKGGAVVLQLGQEQVQRCTNRTGATILNGKMVYVLGATGNRLEIALASNTSGTTAHGTLGMTTEDIANNQSGYVTVLGMVRDINTGAFAEGDILWLSTAGGVTNVQPTAPTHKVRVGICVRSHATVGSIFINPQPRGDIGDLDDVYINAVANNDAFIYNTANSRWQNVTSTGSGSNVLATSPTLVTPDIGAATGASIVLTGSATASAFIPSGATVPTNGLYLPAANTVGLASNSTQAIRINSAQNVIIGNSSTQMTRLDVSTALSAGAVTDVALFSQASGSNPTIGQGARIYLAANTSIARAAAIEAVVTSGINGHDLVLYTNANGATPTEKMRISTAGVVSAIGNVASTSSTTGTVVVTGGLGVSGAINNGGLITSTQTSSGATVEGVRIANAGTGASTKSKLTFYAAATNYGAITGGFGASQPEMVYDIVGASTGAHIFNTSTGVESARINGFGIGIGMTPAVSTAPLDITKNQNATTAIRVLNNDVGVSADARLILSNGTNIAAGMIVRGTGHATEANQLLISSGGAGYPINFYAGGASRGKIQSGGQLTMGGTSVTAQTGLVAATNISPTVQTVSTTTAADGLMSTRYSATGAAMNGLILAHSTNATIDTFTTAVASGDSLGYISFQGSDTAKLAEAVRITGFADAAGGLNSMPGRLVFSTSASGSVTPTERMRITSTGQLGLGVAPSNWTNSYVVFESQSGYIGANDANSLIIGQNNYVNSGVFKYKATNAASIYIQTAGMHRWDSAASGTADATITFTEKMRLNVSGNLGIGTTAPTARLESSIADAATTTQVTPLVISHTTSGTAAAGFGTRFQFMNEDGGGNFINTNSIASIWTDPAIGVRTTAMIFYSGAANAQTEAMRITSTGAVTATANIAASSTSTGTLVVTGGVGVSGDLWAGDLYASTGEITIQGSANSSLVIKNSTNAQTYQLGYNTSGLINGLYDTTAAAWRWYVADTTGVMTVPTSIASTSTSTGALVVTGGVGVGGNVGAASVTVYGVTAGSAVFDTAGSTGGALIEGRQPTTNGAFIDFNCYSLDPVNDAGTVRFFRTAGTNAGASTALAVYSPGTATVNWTVNATTGAVTGVGNNTSAAFFTGTLANTIGSTQVRQGDATHTGYLAFICAATNVRQGYIGFSTTTATADAGTIPYVAGTHAFTGGITATAINSTPIGSTTASTGAFTTLTASSTVTLSPASANVAISPSGTGTVTISPVGALTINPTAASTINNTSIGATTRSTGAFTALAANGAVTMTAGTASTSTTTGTLVVTGGVGVSGAVNTGGGIACVGLTSSSTISTGTAGGIGSLTLNQGNATNSGYVTFYSAGGVRQGYIGFSATTAATDTGTIPYVAGTHAFTGGITATSINSTPIGATTRSSGAFTTLASNAATTMTAGTASTSTGTGTLVVTGGVGVSGAVNAATLTATSYLASSFTGGITAAGATQGTATAISAEYNNVSTVAAGTGVVLPTAVVGRRITVWNNGANTLKVYPAVGATIGTLAVNTPVQVLGGGMFEVVAVTTTNWFISSVNGVQADGGALTIAGDFSAGGSITTTNGTITATGAADVQFVLEPTVGHAYQFGYNGGSAIAGFYDVTGAGWRFYFDDATGKMTVPTSIASTSTSTGAIVVTGGVGIGGAIYAGSVQNTPIGSTTASTGAFTTLTASSTVTLSPASANVAISPSGTGTVTISPVGALTINPTAASTINNASIGATTRSTGAFTTLASNGATTMTAGTASTSSATGTLVVTGGVGVSGNVYSGGNVRVSGASSVIGYDTGSGGAVTQLTSRTTGVTLNKGTGAITLFTAAGSATATTFTVTNSTVAATDVVQVCQKSGTNLYVTIVTAVAAGSFNFTFYTTGGTASDTPVFNFVVVKGVAA